MNIEKIVSKIFGIICLIFFVPITVVALGGSLLDLFRPLTLGMVAGFTLIGSIISLGMKTTLIGIVDSLIGIKVIPIDKDELTLYSQRIKSIALLSASLSALIGVVQVMRNLDNIEEVGHGLAVCFTSYIYGVILAMVLPGTVPDSEKNL